MGSTHWLYQAAFYVDGSAGSDRNPGTIGAPIKTWTRFVDMLGTDPQPRQDVTVNVVSAPSDRLRLSTLRPNGNFTIQGAWSTTLRTGTLTGYTAPVFSVVGTTCTNTQEKITDSAIASFAPYVGKIVKITSGPHVDTYFYIDEDASSGGIGSAYITSPMNTGFATVTLTGNEPYVILDQTAIKIDEVASDDTSAGFVILQDLAVDVSAQFPTIQGDVNTNRCTFTGAQGVSFQHATGSILNTLMNCQIGASLSSFAFQAGGILGTPGAPRVNFFDQTGLFVDKHTKFKNAQLRIHSRSSLEAYQMQVWFAAAIHYPVQFERRSHFQMNGVGHVGSALWGQTATVDPVGCIQASGMSMDSNVTMSLVGPGGINGQIDLGSGTLTNTMRFTSGPIVDPGGCYLDFYPRP